MTIMSKDDKTLNFLESGVEGVYVLDRIAFEDFFDEHGYSDWNRSSAKKKLQRWAEKNLPKEIIEQFDIDLPTVEEVFSQKTFELYVSCKKFKSKQLPIFKDSDNRMMRFEGKSRRWRTRSAYVGADCTVWHVETDGNIGNSDTRLTLGFVPVLRKKRINEEAECWGRLVDVATEYAQKHMHPHKTIIITQQVIELLEGDKAAPIEALD